MIRAFTAAVVLMLCVPLHSASQPADHELPLPQVKGVSIVVRMHFSFMPPSPDEVRRESDTESVFLINTHGYAYARYLCEGGTCAGKELYEYKDGQLIRRSHFKTLDRHMLFVAPAAHSHRLVSEESWAYVDGKVLLARHFQGKTLTREIRYAYNDDGRVTEEHHQYPKQSFVYYPGQYDYILYRYTDDDSVYKLAYGKGRLQDSTAYIERRNSAGQVTERSQISKDGRHFERERNHYDSSGRITLHEAFSDRPFIQADGTVLRADRVEYTYDAKGRPDEVRYIAKGIKWWSYRYYYLR